MLTWSGRNSFQFFSLWKETIRLKDVGWDQMQFVVWLNMHENSDESEALRLFYETFQRSCQKVQECYSGGFTNNILCVQRIHVVFLFALTSEL